MKTTQAEIGLVNRAAEALKAVLGAISSVRLIELKCEPQEQCRAAAILAHANVLGHSHVLACEVNDQWNLRQLKTALTNLRDDGAREAQATRVIIAPHFTPEAQALCRETNTCFIDFEGNARIALGEIFISKRMMQPRMRERVAIDPVMIQEAKSRPPAPIVFIASTIPGPTVRVREGSTAGIAVA
jgi:hypothetical protein